MSPSLKRERLVSVLVGGCAVVVALSLGLSAWTFVRQAQADTVRAADKKSQSTTQVGQCFQQVKNSPQVLRILSIIDILASNSITANRQALAAADPGDPLVKTRQDSISRLVPARSDLRGFIRRTAEDAPTKASCTKLALKLGVDPTKLDR